MSVTFEQARQIVADAVREDYPADNFVVSELGYENADDYMVVAGTAADVYGIGDEPGRSLLDLTMDAPITLVSKETGEFRALYGPDASDYPVDAMRPVSGR